MDLLVANRSNDYVFCVRGAHNGFRDMLAVCPPDEISTAIVLAPISFASALARMRLEEICAVVVRGISDSRTSRQPLRPSPSGRIQRRTGCWLCYGLDLQQGRGGDGRNHGQKHEPGNARLVEIVDAEEAHNVGHERGTKKPEKPFLLFVTRESLSCISKSCETA